MPGSTPATSQLDWLISTTAMIVLSWSRAARDLLKSFGWGIRALHQLVTATMVPFPRRLPHTISPLEGAGFEPSVPGRLQAKTPRFGIVLRRLLSSCGSFHIDHRLSCHVSPLIKFPLCNHPPLKPPPTPPLN